MWEKHKKELIGCGLIAVGIVGVMLIVVAFFECLQIHVPGSREMWVGFIGAIIGGAITLVGVLITIYKQEELDEENRRIENMPILGFSVCSDGQTNGTILTYADNELATCLFSAYEKKFQTILIHTVNNISAFNYSIEGCAINGKVISQGAAFNPSRERIVMGDVVRLVFDCTNINTDIFCLVRFSYTDIFGNKYYQDLPFIYGETNVYVGSEATVKQIIDIRDIKQPILVNQSEPLDETSKNYIDYEIFLN